METLLAKHIWSDEKKRLLVQSILDLADDNLVPSEFLLSKILSI